MLYILKKVRNKNPGDKPGFYFLAKKKVFKKAVDRNRAKRRARAAFQAVLKTNQVDISNLKKTGTSLLFFLERDIIQESFEHLVQSFNTDLLKLK
jgi:ribonuclease P protein component